LRRSHACIIEKLNNFNLSRIAAIQVSLKHLHLPFAFNRVSIEDLCLIPGIGESLAQEIVKYREKRKGFRSIEELKDVKGIGEKKYESLKTFFIIIHQ